MAQGGHQLLVGHGDPRWPGISIVGRHDDVLVGYTVDSYCIWQMHGDELELVEQWPRSELGWSSAKTRYFELGGEELNDGAERRKPWSLLPIISLLVGIGLGVSSLFPAYLSGLALQAQNDQLVDHALLLAGWVGLVPLCLGSSHSRRLGGAFGVGLSATAFGFFFADLGVVITLGLHVAGSGLWLGLLGWLFAACGTVLLAGPAALVETLRRVRPSGSFIALIGTLSVGLAVSFAPSWDSFRLYAAATGQATTLTAGNAFSNPAGVIAGDVLVMVAVVAVALAATWLGRRNGGAALFLGALVPMLAEFVSAIVQVLTPPLASAFGISFPRASLLHLEISSGFTPVFYVYGCLLLILTMLGLAWMGGVLEPAHRPKGVIPADTGTAELHALSEQPGDGAAQPGDNLAPAGTENQSGAIEVDGISEPVGSPLTRGDVGPTPERQQPLGRLIVLGLIGALVLATVVFMSGDFYWSTSAAPSSTTRPASGHGSKATGSPANSAALARGVDPALVDIDSTLGYEQESAYGTGIVIASSGEILTNNHVIAGETAITVRDVGNGRSYAASVVGYDRSADVAVVQLKGASKLTTAAIAAVSNVKVGEGVVAVGNAEGLGGTPSYAGGKVLATDQSITASNEANGTTEQLSDLIKTNAAIIAGDSGGALVNSAGKVIGMVTAGSSTFRFQTAATAGYAIPIREASGLAAKLAGHRASSDVHIGPTAFLGVDVTAPVSGSGAEIIETFAGTPAALAGLSPGDVITSLAGKRVDSPEALTDALLAETPRHSVALTYLDTTGAKHEVKVTLVSGPPQ